MIGEMFNCPMCGHSFDPRDHVACQSCPLQKGCQLVCCPVCGYEMVDVQQSSLANWVNRWLFSKQRETTLKNNEPGKGEME